MDQSREKVTKLVAISLLSGVSFVMQYLNFPIPMLFPSFLKIDFSEIPALAGTLLYGTWAGIGIEFLKNALHFLFSGSETGAIPLGQMANFLAGSTFVIITSWLWKKWPGYKGLIAGMSLATVTMAVLMALANYFILLPAYSYLINWTIPEPEKTALVLYGIAPFNIIKGILISLLFLPLYLKIKPYVTQRLSY
jgi:riboflavin transporter FmnP